MPTVAERFRADVHRDRFGRLLLVLGASFLLSGAIGSVGYRLLIALFNLAALLVAATATGFPSRVPVVPVMVALVGFGVAAAILAPSDDPTLHGISAICTAVVTAGLLFAVLARILGHHDVEMQTIAGALCAYMLIGTFFSSVYAAMDLLGPNTIFSEPMDYADYGYFSFTTLTTTGYGDITVVTNFARRMVMLEAIIGPVFLATTVSRLVSSARRRSVDEVPDVAEREDPDKGR